MTYQGIDTVARIMPSKAKILADNGISFVGRYLVPSVMSKYLSESEAGTLRDAGLAILLLWETTARRALSGTAAGQADGAMARELAKSLEIPTGCAVYFCVDFEAQINEYAKIQQYLDAAKKAVDPYRCGVYGKAGLINCISADVYMQCVAWSYGDVSPKNNIYQYESQYGANAKALAAKVGFDVDLDSCEDLRAAGLWLPDAKPEPTHWYDDTVRWAIKEGIVAGPTIEDARPEDFATRAEVMQMFRNYNRRFEAEDVKTAGGLISD